MLPWLAPISIYWTLAAIYFGGAPIHIEGGGGVQTILGLLVHFAVYLAIFAILRSVLLAPLGEIFGGVIFPLIVTSALLTVTGRLVFRLVGIRIAKDG